MDKRFGVSVYKQKFNFCSAHFLLFPDGTREELHGHNYRVWVDVEAPLGEGDLVVDFTILKPIVKEACDALDHRMMLPSESPFLRIESTETEIAAYHAGARFVFPRRDVLLLPIRNTSTECLAEYLCARVREGLMGRVPETSIRRIRVSVEESSGQCGYYEERE